MQLQHDADIPQFRAGPILRAIFLGVVLAVGPPNRPDPDSLECVNQVLEHAFIK